MGIVKWCIAFIDNYVDNISILFHDPRSNRVNPNWLLDTFLYIYFDQYVSWN